MPGFFRSLARAAVLLVVPLAACTQSVASNGPGTLASPPSGAETLTATSGRAACALPKLLATTPSPAASAIDLWSRAPLGSATALAALEQACEEAADSARGTERAACVLLALVYSAGEGVPKNAHRSFAYLDRGASCAFSFGAHDLAQAQQQGIFLSSVSCCMGAACSTGCADECARAEKAIADAFVPPLERACQAGRASGCFMLSHVAHDRGEHVTSVGIIKAPPQLGGSDALLARSCALGLGTACEALAFAAPAAAEKTRLLSRACDLGWGGGCLHLGNDVAERGGGMKAALPAFERACKLGIRTVCTELATMYGKGEHGAPVDHERAAALEAESWRTP